MEAKYLLLKEKESLFDKQQEEIDALRSQDLLHKENIEHLKKIIKDLKQGLAAKDG